MAEDGQRRYLLLRVGLVDGFGHQQVGGNLSADRLGVVDEHGVGVGEHGGSESADHLLGEPMDGRDGRRVEFGDGRADPLESDLAILAPDLGQQPIVGLGRRFERVGEVDQTGPDPVLQLGCRGPGERDDEQLADGDAVLGHVPGRQGGERERLARAGAGLDGQSAVRERPGQLEGFDDRHDAASSSAARDEAMAPQRWWA